jgi:hypothetical protein
MARSAVLRDRPSEDMHGRLYASESDGPLAGVGAAPFGDGEQGGGGRPGQSVQVPVFGGVEHFANQLPAHRDASPLM